MTEPYPRDLVGYGGSPPPADWPDDARLALSFVLNYEEGGEACVLHGDAASESLSPRGAGRDAAAGPARSQRRIGVRVRRPRRVLADPAPVHRAEADAHRLRGRHGAGAQSRRGARDGRGRLRGGEPRLALDRLSGRARGRGAGAPAAGDRGDRADDRPAPGRLVHRPDQPADPRPRGRGGRLSLRFRTLMPTTCPIG